MIDVKQFIKEKFNIERDLYLYNKVDDMDYSDLVQLLIDFQQRLLQQTDVVRSLPLVEALEQYNGVLVEELNEVVSMVATHGWRSSRVEIGEQLRNRITELKRR